MKQIEIENKLREVISRLITEVELAAKQQRQDINLISEDSWIPILKAVYNCPNLENLNKQFRNFPGIDLGDEVERISFQITSTSGIEKIKNTIQTFKEQEYKNSFDELYIFIITKKQKTYSQEAIDKIIDNYFEFDVKKHIIDPSDILQKITTLRIGVQTRLLKEFEIILGDVEETRQALSIDNVPISFIANLQKISFPEYLYVASIDLDEIGIIESAREHLNFKRGKITNQVLVRLGLLLEGNSSNSWVYHENKIFSFDDVNSESYKRIIDYGTVEKIESSYLYESEFEDYRHLFRYLLKNSVKDILKKTHIEWHRKEKLFYFLPLNIGDDQRKETWIGKAKAERTVYLKRMKKKDPEKLAYHQHLAFNISFENFGNEWYCTITPTWLYTFDLYKKSRFHDDLLSTQKRLEYDGSVRNLTRCIAYILSSTSLQDHGVHLHFDKLCEFEYIETKAHP